MFLQDSELKRALSRGFIRVEPLGENAIQPGSIDIRLGGSVRCWRDDPGRMSMGMPRVLGQITNNDMVHSRHGQGEQIRIEPQQMILVSSQEIIGVDDQHLMFLEGCSSIGRQGLMVTNAGLVDPGFGIEADSTLTLELYNQAPFPLIATIGQVIAQICVARMTGRAERPYGTPGLGSRYQGQQLAEGPRVVVPAFGEMASVYQGGPAWGS